MRVDIAKVNEIIIRNNDGKVVDRFKLSSASLITNNTDKSKILELKKIRN